LAREVKHEAPEAEALRADAATPAAGEERAEAVVPHRGAEPADGVPPPGLQEPRDDGLVRPLTGGPAGVVVPEIAPEVLRQLGRHGLGRHGSSATGTRFLPRRPSNVATRTATV